MVKDLCFEIIEICPNQCKFCSSNSCTEKNQKISFADYQRVIDHFQERGGIEELSLSGGEPFLHPELFSMVQYAKEKGIKTVIFTSGVRKGTPIPEEQRKYYINEREKIRKEIEEKEPWNLFLKRKVETYYENFLRTPNFQSLSKQELQTLKEIGLDKIVFDYQAYEQETDENLMGRDAAKRTCLLESLVHASLIGLPTEVHFVPMKPNYEQILDILEMLEIAGIDQISILRFVPQGRGKTYRQELELSASELEKFMELLEKGRSIYSGKIRFGIPFREENTHQCNAGLEKLDIKYDGTVLPCPAFKELDRETAQKYGIRFYNIYENLTEVHTPGGTRKEPLCKKIYHLD